MLWYASVTIYDGVTPNITLGSGKVGMYYKQINPRGGTLKLAVAITRLTAHFTCNLMFVLVVSEQNQEYGHTCQRMSSECPYGDRVGVVDGRVVRAGVSVT